MLNNIKDTADKIGNNIAKYTKDMPANIINTKLFIYESYDNGIINEYEKIELLNILESIVQDEHESQLNNKLNKFGDINRAVNNSNTNNYSNKKYEEHLKTIEDSMDKIYKRDNI